MGRPVADDIAGQLMDDTLKTILADLRADAAADPTVRFTDPATGGVEVRAAGRPAVPYTLRPLADLYGPGTGRDTLDAKDKMFEPLLMAIEQVFVDRSAVEPKLTDAAVGFALDRLCMSPDAAPGDPLAVYVQLSLRLALSLGDYSRQDVRLALRKVRQSVARHTKVDGPMGYLTFIREFMPG